MNAFFWNTMILFCHIGVVDPDKVNPKCITYMVECFNGERGDLVPANTFLMCQNQYLQIQNAYKDGGPDKKLYK